MRDYSYIDSNRYSILNLFRSLRFDVDRVDINQLSARVKPDFVRGFRIVDHEGSKNYLVSAQDADNLIFSLASIYSEGGSEGLDPKRVEAYLIGAIETGHYLITEPPPAFDLNQEYLH